MGITTGSVPGTGGCGFGLTILIIGSGTSVSLWLRWKYCCSILSIHRLSLAVGDLVVVEMERWSRGPLDWKGGNDRDRDLLLIPAVRFPSM